MLRLPVAVSGRADRGPFGEETHTIVVNAHGALISLKTAVVKGQRLCIKRAAAPDEQECQVNWIGPTADGKTQYGIEFTRPSPKFWGISFPPADWSPSTAEAVAEATKG